MGNHNFFHFPGITRKPSKSRERVSWRWTMFLKHVKFRSFLYQHRNDDPHVENVPTVAVGMTRMIKSSLLCSRITRCADDAEFSLSDFALSELCQPILHSFPPSAIYRHGFRPSLGFRLCSAVASFAALSALLGRNKEPNRRERQAGILIRS